MLLEEDHLVAENEAECVYVDRAIEDFVLLDHNDFDPRIITIMWRPLFESGLWEQIVEFKPEGLRALKRMVEDSGVNADKKS